MEKSEWAEDFKKFKAKWHKSCRQKFTNEKLEKMIRSKERLTESKEVKDVKPSRSKAKPSNDICFFCDEESEPKSLTSCRTLGIDEKVRALCDFFAIYAPIIRPKLSQGDMVAIDARYHLKCLSSFYKDADRRTVQEENYASIQAFEKISIVIKKFMKIKSVDAVGNFLLLKDIHLMYNNSLEELSEYSISKINQTRLKEKILEEISRINLYQKRKGYRILQN